MAAEANAQAGFIEIVEHFITLARRLEDPVKQNEVFYHVGQIVNSINPQALQVLGYTPGTGSSKQVIMIIPPGTFAPQAFGGQPPDLNASSPQPGPNVAGGIIYLPPMQSGGSGIASPPSPSSPPPSQSLVYKVTLNCPRCTKDVDVELS